MTAGRAALGCILAAAILARLLFPQADPPLTMGGSGGIFSDEGTYTNNARNLVLFGQAFTDEWNSYEYSPVLHGLQLPVFALLGVGLLQERLIPMAFGIATVALLFLVAARAWGREAGLYAAFFLATSYFTITHNRLGLVETPQAFIMVLAVLLWQRAREGRILLAAAAGAAVALVVITKSLGLWFVAAFYAAAAGEVLVAPAGERAAAARRLGAALLASAGAMALWYVLFYLPNRESLLRFGAAYKRLSIPRSAGQALENLRKLWFVGYYRPEWVALALAFAAAAALLLRCRVREIRERVEAWRLLVWLLAGMAALDVLSYNPPRYFLPLLPAVAGLAGWCLAALRRAAPAWPAPPSAPGLLAAWAWLTLAAGYLPVHAAAKRWDLGPCESGVGYWALAGAMAAAALAVAFLRGRLPAPPDSPARRFARGAAIAALLLASLAQNWEQYALWARNRRYTVLETSRELAPVVDGGLLAGLFGPVLALENKARVLYALEPWCNYERVFERFPVTHFILADYIREATWWWNRYPEQMARTVPLRVYRIWNTNLYLLSLRESDRGVFNRLRTDRGGPLDSTLLASESPRELAPGAGGAGSVTFRNSGASSWSAGAISLGLWRGRALGPSRIPLPAGTVVRPGETVTLAIPHQAPKNTGFFMGEWRLQDADGRWFGDFVAEGILVRGPGGEI